MRESTDRRKNVKIRDLRYTRFYTCFEASGANLTFESHLEEVRAQMSNSKAPLDLMIC